LPFGAEARACGCLLALPKNVLQQLVEDLRAVKTSDHTTGTTTAAEGSREELQIINRFGSHGDTGAAGRSHAGSVILAIVDIACMLVGIFMSASRIESASRTFR
jgi:hypothetical protein